MDFNDFDDKKNESDVFNSNKNKVKIFLTGLLAGVVGFVSVCAAFPYVNGGFRNAFLSGAGVNQFNSSKEVTTKIDRIYDILDTYYVNEYDKGETIESLYYGIVYGVGDPYTVYMPKETYTKFREETEGTYAGIGVGINIDTSDNSIVVISPFEGCPGALAGILPGDKIIKINDTEVSGDILDKAVSMMKGEPGTNVNITIYRPSEERIIELTVTRQKIDVPTVYHKMIDNEIGYIRITQFDRVTYDQFISSYNELKENMRGLVLDLRNNPGGLLDVVTDITDILVPEGNIVYTEDKQGNKSYTKSDPGHIEVPLLVLINGNSASASEVLSGAVQDMGVGQLVGTQTFGKGVVQNIFELGDGSAVKATIAKYYTPNGICIHGKGLTPNYEVEMDNKLTIKISSLTIDEDEQLKKAVEIMNEKIGGTALSSPF